jgi:hypothetical protein
MAEEKIPEWRKKQLDLMLECMIDASAVLTAFIEHTGARIAISDDMLSSITIEFYQRRHGCIDGDPMDTLLNWMKKGGDSSD